MLQSQPDWLEFVPDELRKQYAKVQAEVLRKLEHETPEEPGPQQEAPAPASQVPAPRVPAPENVPSTSQPNTPATVVSVTSAMRSVSVQDNSGEGSMVSEPVASAPTMPGIPVSKNPFDALAYFSDP